MLQNINKLWTQGISFHKTLHLYKITTFSAGEGNKQRHIHIFYHRLLVFVQTTFIFVTMPFSKLKAGILTKKGGMVTAKYFGLNSPVPWHHILARMTPGQGTHSCWAKCQHKSERTGVPICVWFSNVQLACTA